MKNKRQTIFISIIFILFAIIIYQIIISRKTANENFVIPITLLTELIKTKQESIGKEETKYIHDLVEYCLKNNVKDSINKFIDIACDQISPLLKNNTAMLGYLSSKNERQRIYSYKILEYLMLNNYLEKKSAGYFQFDNVGVRLFSNAQFKNNTLNLGDNYECYILVGANNTENPIRININGEKEILMKDEIYTKFTRASTTKGEKEVKGTVTFLLNRKDFSLDFSQKYVVK